MKDGDKLLMALRVRELYKFLLVPWRIEYPWPNYPVRKN
jgi:hypothetical protein